MPSDTRCSEAANWSKSIGLFRQKCGAMVTPMQIAKLKRKAGDGKAGDGKGKAGVGSGRIKKDGMLRYSPQ